MIAYDRAEAEIPDSQIDAGLARARAAVYWLDNNNRPAARPALATSIGTDLAVVGGGYTGLWTALMAKERDPKRRVVVLEGKRIGWAASGRNGGFCEPSLTHGESNGQRHLPDETELLHELGVENMREIAETIARYGIDCDLESTGVLKLATEPHQVDWLKDLAVGASSSTFLDRDAVQAQVHSPLYHAGLWEHDGALLIHPAKLAWGLLKVCLDLGVEVYENSPVTGISGSADAVTLSTAGGTVSAASVALATNVFPSLLKRTRLHTVPVYDYCLMTEPLTDEQIDALGWSERQGLSDLNNRFHYYRRTTDADGGQRILFGGYDAIYHYGRSMKPEYEHSESTYRKLAAHFYATFPQLSDVRFSHTWGGAIDTCSRFFSFFDVAYGGRVAYAAGFTGLGVAATRFGANVMLDLLSGKQTTRTALKLVRTKPIPFPPEPLAWIGVQITSAAMARADRNDGKEGLWLKTMNAVGMGFDS